MKKVRYLYFEYSVDDKYDILKSVYLESNKPECGYIAREYEYVSILMIVYEAKYE